MGPKEQQFTWRIIHFFRTVAEDVPQAILQTFFVIYVRKNCFMVISILCAVGGSMMALKDAIGRALVASGFKPGELLAAIHVNSGWAIHCVILETDGGHLKGRYLENSQEDVDLNDVEPDKYKGRGVTGTLELQEGEHIVQVKGQHCKGGYLCYELELITNTGISKKFTAGQPDWAGDEFSYEAKPGFAVSNVLFGEGSEGRCTGIEEV